MVCVALWAPSPPDPQTLLPLGTAACSQSTSKASPTSHIITGALYDASTVAQVVKYTSVSRLKRVKSPLCMGMVQLPRGPSVLSWAGWGAQELPSHQCQLSPLAFAHHTPSLVAASRAHSPSACLVSSCNHPVYCSEKVKLVRGKKNRRDFFFFPFLMGVWGPFPC